jgi:hypothetical protein
MAAMAKAARKRIGLSMIGFGDIFDGEATTTNAPQQIIPRMSKFSRVRLSEFTGLCGPRYR